MSEVTGKGLWGSGLVLTLGSDTDDDTLNNLFGHMSTGYLIRINGQDVVVIKAVCMADERMDRADDRWGILFDHLGTPGTYENTPRAHDHPDHVEVADWIAWDDVESVHVY